MAGSHWLQHKEAQIKRRKQPNGQTGEVVHTEDRKKDRRRNSFWALGVALDKEQGHNHGNTAVHMEDVIDWQSQIASKAKLMLIT